MRIPFIALTVVAILALLPESAAAERSTVAEHPVMLRQAVTISDDVVHLGDLFVDAGDKADVRIARAPAPGRRIVLNAHVLYRIAQAHDLDWRPLSVRDQVVVERDSIVIEGEEIERHILASLADRGVDPDRVAVELGDPGLRLYLSADADPTVAVEQVAYDPRSGRFAAVLVAPSGNRATQPVRVSGRLHDVTEVPVLAQRVMRGQVISAGDVEWQKTRTERLPANAVLDADGLIGLTPKRTLQPGQPVRVSEVQRPVIVPKGGLVTLVLTTSGMQLTARGRALEDGGEGDVIRVANAHSRTLVEGVVTSAGQVLIRLPGSQAMN